MATDYEVRLATADGTEFARISDFLSLVYRKKVNQPGLAEISVPGDHRILDDLEHRSQIEIWRRNRSLSLDWYCDFYGFYTDQERSRPQRSLFTMRCPGLIYLLRTRYVMWYSGTANRSTFDSVAAETIMKTLVDYNIGANATTGNGRIRNGTLTGMSVAADGGAGDAIGISCAWRNLLSALQAVAGIADADFDVIKTGANTFEFRYYADRRGEDRTSGSGAVAFSLEQGNMANPVYRYDRTDAVTDVVVAGQGRGPNREVAALSSSVTPDVELFVDARDIGIGETSLLLHRATERLREREGRQELDFDVLQTPGCAYGVHYCVDGVLGDLVQARYLDIEMDTKVVGVTVEIDKEGHETIDVDMETE
jgi:hypothetical protein